MRDFAQFWAQLMGFLEENGLMLLSATVISAVTFGYITHYVFNIRPLRKSEEQEKQRIEKERAEEAEDAAIPLYHTDGKRIGVVKGVINKDMVQSVRNRKKAKKQSERGLQGAMRDIALERRELIEMNSLEDDDNLVKLVENDSGTEQNQEEEEVEEIETEGFSRAARGSNASQSSVTGEDSNILGNIGTLHGKLATAQLRARTKQMQMEMTEEEKQSEAAMKAQQLSSIMALMMENKDKFGMETDDVKEQLNLYNF